MQGGFLASFHQSFIRIESTMIFFIFVTTVHPNKRHSVSLLRCVTPEDCMWSCACYMVIRDYSVCIQSHMNEQTSPEQTVLLHQFVVYRKLQGVWLLLWLTVVDSVGVFLQDYRRKFPFCGKQLPQLELKFILKQWSPNNTWIGLF